MTTEAQTLTIGDLRVSLVRKGIKNLHLGVYPPDGRVRVAAPLALSTAAVRVAVIERLQWIRRQQAAFGEQARESAREMVEGESHYFLGRRYRLLIRTTAGKSYVAVQGSRALVLYERRGTTKMGRRRLLDRWYREQLRVLVPPLLERWAGRLAVGIEDWGIKRMRTRWGSCNPDARRIWLNVELAKKPFECLEYVIAHEMTHLLVRTHDEQFRALMDRQLPRWREARTRLNAEPLGDVVWD